VNPESPGVGARLRAVAAAALASLAAAARRLEEWSARGSRPVLVGLLVVAVLLAGVLVVAFQSRDVAAWLGDDRPAHSRSERFAGKPQIKHGERFEERRGRGAVGRPEVPRPPMPPSPPQPPAP
jgi:hypothetical protein